MSSDSLRTLSSPVRTKRLLAIFLYFLRIAWALQSSLLFLRPYSPTSRSSSINLSARHGCLGVSYFFLGLFGSPIPLEAAPSPY